MPKRKRKPRHSKVSIKFLEELKDRYNLNILHARNVGEKILSPTYYRADGFVPELNLVLEFHGNKAHANPYFYESSQKISHFRRKLTARTIFNKTLQREQDIIDNGYSLAVIWEHEYKNSFIFKSWCFRFKLNLYSGKPFYQSSTPDMIENANYRKRNG